MTWRRFGLSYAFLAAMIFVLFLPGYWTLSIAAQHLIVAVFYATGLVGVAAVRSRHRFDYLEEAYSLVEALLWRGIYLAINLQLSSLNLSAQWWGGSRAASEFARPFYWTTWVLIWCLAGVELEQIQFLLGHASVETTERYLGCKQNLNHAVNDNLGLEDT